MSPPQGVSAEQGAEPASMGEPAPSSPIRVCVVGAGPRFLSGISYYTNRLINALGTRYCVSAILVRRMMPAWMYPGRTRVGTALTQFEYPAGTVVLDGIDWYWVPSMYRAIRHLRRERPEVLVLQWWTATVFHSYFVLAVIARSLGARVVIEFHELLDTAELRLWPIRWYLRLISPILIRLAHAFVVHSEFDRSALLSRYSLPSDAVALVPHGPYDQYRPHTDQPRPQDDLCRLLYFGVIRPFKGVEDIVTALELMTEEDAARFSLTVVGETWEGWTVPAERIARSPLRGRINFVNRYVADEEVAGFFAEADVVVLPYHRSSASGPLHIAMACGLPVVVSAVGGLKEAVERYEGAITVPPQDPPALRDALLEVVSLRGHRYRDDHSWGQSLEGYDRLFADLALRSAASSQRRGSTA